MITIDHFEPYLEKSFHRLPMLERAGIRKFFSGPESFTPDTQYLLGETPEVKNLYTCCGFNSFWVLFVGKKGINRLNKKLHIKIRAYGSKKNEILFLFL